MEEVLFQEKIHQKLGNIDVLINNAGIFPKGKLLDLNKETLDQVFAINLFEFLGTH